MPSASENLDAYLRDRATRALFSGVVLLRGTDRELFAGAYGYASRAWRVCAHLGTRFDIASIAKLFTAVAVLQQVDRGHLSLETSAVAYLDLAGTAISPDVQVHHLLTHTSGIADDAEEEEGEQYADLWRTRPNYAVTEAIHFLPQFAHKPPNFAPGSGCRYCNCAYVLLGLMVEKASERPFRDYVRAEIFAPAGMDNSGYFHLAEVHSDVAEGADPIRDASGAITGWRKSIYAYPPIGTPDGGGYVTARDLVRFLSAVQTGRLLSPESTRYFFTPQALHRDRGTWKKMYGPGLWFHVQNDGTILFYEKEGSNAGGSGMIRHYPALGVTLALLCNMQDAAWDPARHIHALLLGGEFETPS